MSRTPIIFGEISGVNGCCGLMEFHDLEADRQERSYYFDKYYTSSDLRKVDHAVFATTVKVQRKEIAFLKRAGFKPVGRWKNSNSGNVITMWLKVPSKRKRKK